MYEDTGWLKNNSNLLFVGHFEFYPQILSALPREWGGQGALGPGILSSAKHYKLIALFNKSFRSFVFSIFQRWSDQRYFRLSGGNEPGNSYSDFFSSLDVTMSWCMLVVEIRSKKKQGLDCLDY